MPRGFDKLPAPGQTKYRDCVRRERIPDLLSGITAGMESDNPEANTIREAVNYIYDLEDAIVQFEDWTDPPFE